MKCRKQRTCHLLSTRQILKSNTPFEMTYKRDTHFARSFCSGSDHPELPRMIQANSVFQYWASPNDLVPHRMIWTQTGLTGVVDRSDRSGGPVWPRDVYLCILKWEVMEWIVIWRTLSLKAKIWVHKSYSKYYKHNFNTCKLLVCFDQICKWASPYSLSNKVPPS